MPTSKEELRRLVEQQKRDQESGGTGRGWSKHRTYSVDFRYIANDRNPLNPFQRKVKEKLVSRQDEEIRCNANLELVLKGLPKKQQFIIRRKIRGYTQAEIAKELKTYQQEISDILKKLKPHFGLKAKPVSKLVG